MEDNDLIIEIDDQRNELQEKSAQILLAFIVNQFNGKPVSYDYIRRMVMHAGGQEISDSDLSRCISHALLVCNDTEIEDWIGHTVYPYLSAFK